MARGHRCRCPSLPARAACPVCCVRDQLAFLRRQFPTAWVDGVPGWGLPLFPQASGAACAKDAFVGTIVQGALQLQVPLASADGATRVSGHSLRVSGAQGLTRMSFPLWAIQLLGRWGSDAVKGYVGDTALEVFSEGVAQQPRDAESLEAIFSAAGRSLPADDRPAVRPGPTALDRDAVEQLVARVTGDLHSELAAALRAEVRLELARRKPAERERSVESVASGTVPPLVRNERTKTVHLVGIGADSDLPASHWQSLCGWAFGQWGGFCLLGGVDATPTCKQCLGHCTK